MSRKRKDIVLEHLEIASLEFQGKGVARHQSKVVFVEGALPGDVVDVKLVQNKKDYAIGSNPSANISGCVAAANGNRFLISGNCIIKNTL
jgi:predicted RNA-binding protein with TRAM domain